MRKLTHKPQKVNAEVIGLDVHKRLIVFSRLDRRGQEVECGSIPSQRADLQAFFRRAIGRKKTHVVFEASRSSLWVYGLACEMYGADRVHVAQAKKIRAIANSQEKNDFNDAWWLAYLTQEGRLPEAYVPPTAILELRIATRERYSLVRRRAQVFTRMRSHLAQLGVHLAASSLHTHKARVEILEIIQRTPGCRGLAMSSCLREIDSLDHAVDAWDREIEGLAGDIEAVQLIEREAPGVGRVLAATIIAESGEIDRFRSAKSFARYAGLTPSDRSSGGKTTHGGITREGSPYLRWALTQATTGCLRARRGPAAAAGEWIRAKLKRLGIYQKARVAAARKIAESIWRIFHYGECFDPAKPFGSKRAAA